MRIIPQVFAVMALVAASASADIIVTFDNPTQTGTPGQTLTYTATILNNGATSVFFNTDFVNLSLPSFTVTDNFFANVPISLDAGMSATGVDLFEVMLSNPFTDPFASYQGSYVLFGGADGNQTDPLTNAVFTTIAAPAGGVPEPASIVMFASAMGAILAIRRRSKKPALREIH